MENENMEMDNIVVLSDDEGNELNFQWIDTVNYEGNDYAFMLPADDEEPDQVVILLIVPSEENEEEISFETIEDEELLDAVFNIFVERAEEE